MKTELLKWIAIYIIVVGMIVIAILTGVLHWDEIDAISSDGVLGMALIALINQVKKV